MRFAFQKTGYDVLLSDRGEMQISVLNGENCQSFPDSVPRIQTSRFLPPRIKLEKSSQEQLKGPE